MGGPCGGVYGGSQRQHEAISKGRVDVGTECRTILQAIMSPGKESLEQSGAALDHGVADNPPSPHGS